MVFETTVKLGGDCVVLDFIFHSGHPWILEVSCGFIKAVYNPCEGFWDREMNWNPGDFNPQGWIVQTTLDNVTSVHAV